MIALSVDLSEARERWILFPKWPRSVIDLGERENRKEKRGLWKALLLLTPSESCAVGCLLVVELSLPS